MTRCAYCNSLLLFGGIKAGPNTFCNAKCQQGAYYLSMAQQIPAEAIVQTIQHIDLNGCPKCKGAGPIDVHTSHFVWSLLVLTSWSSKPHVVCRPCGVKSQLGSAALSLVCGWWGIPWGLIMTPIQVTRNIVGMCSNPAHPTDQLKRIVSLNMAAQIAAQRRQTPPTLNLPPTPPSAPMLK